MKHLYSALGCLAAAGCMAAGPAFAQAPKTTGDQQFVNFAAQTDMVEANLGQLAQQNASNQEVKSYGQMLVTDHTNDFGQLHTAAQQAGLTVPNAIDPAHNKALIDPLEKLKGAAFDKRYIAEMVKGHTQAIAIYKKEAADGQNAAIKSYAAAALPVLQKHLDDAKAIEQGKTPPIQ